MPIDRRIVSVIAFIVVALVIWSQTSAPPRRRHIPEDRRDAVPASPTEQYGDLIQAFKNDIDTLQRANRQLADQVKKLEERIELLEKRTDAPKP